MTERWLMDSVEMYQQVREGIRMLESGGSVYIGENGGGYTFLNAVLPDSTAKRFKREIIEEMKGCMIALRSQIRDVLDADEKEQLKFAEEEEAVSGYVDQVVPKNDYRRQQNSQEDDDGK